jgi:hypothetical protein
MSTPAAPPTTSSSYAELILSSPSTPTTPATGWEMDFGYCLVRGVRQTHQLNRYTVSSDHTTMNQPTLTHPRFGALHFNPLLNWYESDCNEPEIGRFKICIDLDDDGTPAEILVRAELAFVVAKTRYTECVSYAASKLTDDYNKGWNDEMLITESEFIRCISLSSLVLHYGQADFYFDDGGLFAGHSIRVEMEADGTFTDAFYEG